MRDRPLGSRRGHRPWTSRRISVSLTRALCDLPSVSGDERALADAIEAALRAVRRTSRCSATATRSSPGRTSAGRRASSSPATSTPCRSPTTCPRGSSGEGAQAELWGRGTVDMKARRRRAARARGGADASRRATSRGCSTTTRRSPPTLNGLGRIVREHPDWVAGDFAILGEPTNGGHRGRLQRHAARRGAAHGRRRPLGAGLDGRQRDPRRRRGAAPARGVHAPRRSRSTGWSTARASTRCWSRAASAAQRHPGRLRRHGELPVRAVGERRAGVGPRARAVRRVRRRDRRRRARRAPGPRRPGRAGVRARRAGDHRRCARGQVRLDRRRPVLRARRARGELRPRATRCWRTRTTSGASSARSPLVHAALRDWLTA